MRKVIIFLSFIVLIIFFSCKKEDDKFCWICQTEVQQFPIMCEMSQKEVNNYITHFDSALHMKCYIVDQILVKK